MHVFLTEPWEVGDLLEDPLPAVRLQSLPADLLSGGALNKHGRIQPRRSIEQKAEEADGDSKIFHDWPSIYHALSSK